MYGANVAIQSAKKMKKLHGPTCHPSLSPSLSRARALGQPIVEEELGRLAVEAEAKRARATGGGVRRGGRCCSSLLTAIRGPLQTARREG